jgi:hypothetical protein
MTKSVDKYFELHDRAIAAGLPEIAKAMVDTIINNRPFETNVAGACGRWKTEARQVLRRRAGNVQQRTGNDSADARALRRALLRYSSSGGFERDSLPALLPPPRMPHFI